MMVGVVFLVFVIVFLFPLSSPCSFDEVGVGSGRKFFVSE